jgi:fumarate reductase subunit C
MPGSRISRSGAVVSAVLAVLTLVVFFLSMGQGPESAVRRLHEYIATDPDLAPTVFLEANPERMRQQVIDDVKEQMSRATTIHVRSESVGKQAIVVASYFTETSGTHLRIYMVIKSQNRWKIDALESTVLTRRMLESGSG